MEFTFKDVTLAPATPAEQARTLQIAIDAARKILVARLIPTGWLNNVEDFADLAYQLHELGFSDDRIGSIIIGAAKMAAAETESESTLEEDTCLTCELPQSECVCE